MECHTLSAGRAAALAALVLLPAAAGSQERAPGPAIGSITFPGRAALPEERLLQVSGLEPGAAWTSAAEDEALKRLRAWDFIDAAGPARTTPRPDGKLDVALPIRERPSLARIEFHGIDALGESDLKTACGLRVGQPFRAGDLAAAEEAILRRSQEDGFLLAVVRADAVPEGLGRVAVTFAVEEGRRLYLGAVKLEGARQLAASSVLSVLKLQPRRFFGLLSRGHFAPHLLEEDLQRLREHYRARGFLEVEAGLADLRLDARRRRVEVVLAVDEGRRFVIGTVRIEGNTLFPQALLERELALPPGGYYDAEEVEEGARRLLRWYQEHADRVPEIRWRRTLHDDRLTIAYEIDEKEHRFTGEVRITGNTRTRERVIRQEIALTPGEPFTLLDVERSNARLQKRGLFAAVEAQALEDSPLSTPERPVQDVEFRVTETEKQGILEAGGGASSGEGEVAYFRIFQPNFDLFRPPRAWNDWEGAFAGGGQFLNIELIPGTRESQYRFRFLEPYLFRSDLGLAVSGNTSIFDRDSYEERRLRLSASVEKFFDRDRHLSASLGYVAEKVSIGHLENDAPADAAEARGSDFLGYPRLELRWDDLEFNYFSGPRGFRASAFADLAASETGSDVEFLRLGTRADFFAGLWDDRPDFRHTLHLGLEVGGMDSLEGGAVPLYERFYLGGPRSFRGFAYRRLGPHDGDTPIGGEGLIRGTVEYSLPLFWREVRAIGLFDWGDLEPSFSSLSTGRFRTAAGGGLEIRLRLIGQQLPVNLYWVQALASEREDREQLFTFTLGFALP
jgi:outer membrane protein insertion porin family